VLEFWLGGKQLLGDQLLLLLTNEKQKL